MFIFPPGKKPPLQISSLGSADPKNVELQQGFKGQLPAISLLNISPEQQKQMHTTLQMDWEESANNPIIQDFNSLFDAPVKGLDNPEVQNKLFDVDNFVKGQAGIFRTKQDGLVDFGTDIDGKSLWAMNDIKDSDSFDLGKNKLYTTGTLLQQLGAFSDEEESDNFAAFTEAAGDPMWMGEIAGMSAAGNARGAVDSILNKLGMGGLQDLENSPNKEKGYGIAFAAFNHVKNLDKLSPSQQSLSIGTLASMAYKFKDGSNVSQRPLIQDTEGNTQLTAGEALNLAGAGIDVFGLQKNWDQIDALQRITYGPGTASQMAATGKRMGMLNNPGLGGKSLDLTPEQLGEKGFTSVPSAGIGAITGMGDALPKGYEVVGAGQAPGQVIAVPTGMSRTASTINGASDIRTLNDAPGVKKAGIGAFKVHSKWNPVPTNPQNGAIGTNFGTALSASGVLEDPYMRGSIAATSVFGNTVSKNPAAMDFQSALTASGVNSPTAKKNYNIREMAKKDQTLNTTIQGTQAIVNTMAKYGNDFAKGGAPYVNAIAAGKQLFDVFNNPNATNKQKMEALAGAGQTGVNAAAQLGSDTAAGFAPGVNYAMAAYSVSKIFGSNLSDKQKATALRRTAEDTALAYTTLGLSSVIQFADAELFGGKLNDIRNKVENVLPITGVVDKLFGSAIGGVTGGKNKEQQGRDQIRKAVTDLTDGKWGIQLSDGTTADIGTDGKGGQHEFRFADKSMGVNRPLNAYDVDYTNDLDFTSNMMSSALMRLVAGGKGTSIDQIAGQMGNAALGQVGFGQDMTEENFAYVRDNVKSWFFKKGIQTKEDAYALNNQMFSEGRSTEMDQVAIQQGIDMVFGENGFDTANVLMAGRWKGLDVASDISKAPGPNFDSNITALPRPTPDSGFEIDPGFSVDFPKNEDGSVDMSKVFRHDLVFNAGTYGGNSNTDAFTKSIIKYQNKTKKAA